MNVWINQSGHIGYVPYMFIRIISTVCLVNEYSDIQWTNKEQDTFTQNRKEITF